MEHDSRAKHENLHKNHRQRVYERLEKEGIESFADHEIIELLLFFTVARKDTNPLAHRLIEEYGSLSGVLDADFNTLENTQGVSQRSAILLHLIPALLRRYNLDRLQPRSALDSAEKACTFAKALMVGKRKETFYILCLDSKNHLINAVHLKEGTPNELIINPRAVVVSATKHEATGVILVHNHPGGNIKPSFEDLSCTRKIALALGVIGIPLLDHVIVSEQEALSFKREDLMDEIIKSVALRIETTRSNYI